MFLAVDIGGTKTLLSTFDEAGHIESEQKFPTAAKYQDFLQNLKTNLVALGQSRFDFAGVAIPGNVDRKTGVGLEFGNLEWKNVPIKSDIEALAGCELVLENDAKAGAYFEAKYVINEFKNVLFITIGTGIGIAHVMNGVIDTTMSERGGKIILLEVDGIATTWEKLVSGKAIVSRYGKKASEITDTQTWQQISHYLALGMVRLIKELSPEVIIIGGGVGSHYQHFDGFLTTELQRMLGAGHPLPALRQASKPDEAVIYGCYELAKEQYGKSR